MDKGTEGPKLRLFVGFGVPRTAGELLGAAVAPWHRMFPDARWVPSVDWHVTLKFLGGATPSQAAWVGERLREVAADTTPLRTRLEGLGCFPSPDRARVLWAGLDDRAGRMAELALAIEGALAREFTPEARPFAPHLTLARCARPLVVPREYLRTPVRTEPFTVSAMTVFRSDPSGPPPRYAPVDVLAFEHLFE